MKLTKEQKAIYRKAYQNCVNTFIGDAGEHSEGFLDQVEKFGKLDHDMSDLAIKGFLYNMHKFYQHHTTIQGLVDEAKSIIKK